MIIHIVRLNFKEGLDEKAVDDAMEAARQNIVSEGNVVWWHQGAIMGNPLEPYSYAIVCGFSTLQDYQSFLSSPAHRKNDFLIHPILEGGTSFCLSEDSDPKIADAIVETTRKALESDPERLEVIAEVTEAEGRLKDGKWL